MLLDVPLVAIFPDNARGASAGCLIRSNGLRDMWCLYQASAAQTTSFHHSAAVSERSAMIGSANSSQPPRIRGLCCASHGARGGRCGLPARIVSIPLTIPMSSLGSCIRFCISFMESIMRDMNSSDFSVKLAVPSFLDLWGPAASLVVSAFYFGNVVSLQLQSLGVLQPPLWWSQPPFVPHWVWRTAVLLRLTFQS